VEKELVLKPKKNIADIKSIVAEDEVTLVKFELRARLILANVNKENFIKNLFAAHSSNKTISIKELAKELTRKPLELPYEQGLMLARYIMEPRNSPEVEVDINREQPLETLRQNLNKALEITYNIEEDSIEKILKKVKAKQSQLLNQLINKRNPNQWMKVLNTIDPNLTQLDKDILIAIGFERNKDIKRLSVNVCLIYNEI